MIGSTTDLLVLLACRCSAVLNAGGMPRQVCAVGGGGREDIQIA